MSRNRGARIMGTTMVVSLVVLLSKALGFVREMIVANVYGTSSLMDAYNAAYGIYYLPVLLFNSCITSTLVPLYIQARQDKGLRRANRFASNTLNIFSLIALGISLLMFAFAGPIVRLVYSKLDTETSLLTVRLTRIMLPSLVFFVAAIVFSSILNANERYVPAQLTGFPLSVAMIASSLMFNDVLGAEAMAAGIAAAGVLQVLTVLPFLKGFRYSLRINFHDPRFQKLMRLATPAILSMAVNELSHLIAQSLASGEPEGSMSAMNFAYRLLTFALGVLIVPLTTVMFSKMSDREARKDRKGMLAIMSQCLEVIVMVTLPIIIIVSVLSHDVVALAYKRGMFDAESVRITSGVFIYFMLGLTGFALRDLFNRAFHSLKNTAIPMWVALGSVALNIAFSLILIHPMGVNGLALASSLSGTAGAATLLILLHKRVGKMRFRRTIMELMIAAISGILCGAACLLLNRIIPEMSGTLKLLVRVGFISLAGCGIYLASLLLLGSRNLRAAQRLLRARKK